MKSLFTSLALASTLLVGGLAAAQSTRVVATATFYDNDPAAGGQEVASATLTDSPISKTFADSEDMEDAEYVTLQVGEASGTFELASGGTSNITVLVALDGLGGESDLSLARIVNTLQKAADGDVNLAVFRDEDGVITGFYDFPDNVNPNVRVGDAETVTFFVDGQSGTFDVQPTGDTKLSDVRINMDGEFRSLFQVSLELARNN